MFISTAEAFGLDRFKNLNIVASNDINEAVLNALNEQVCSLYLYIGPEKVSSRMGK